MSRDDRCPLDLIRTELLRERSQHLLFFAPLLPLIPSRLKPERQQDRADDHHAFHEDAKPGDLSLQFPPIRSRSSVNQFLTRINLGAMSTTPLPRTNTNP